jgi:CRISPR-associated protein Csd1
VSWMQRLYETYNNCAGQLGAESESNDVPLLPICHTTQMAHVEIVIDGGGNFLRARVIPKAEARTIIPCTEASGGRTSGAAPHPLCDKLQYVAADYAEYETKKSANFTLYDQQLTQWFLSEFSHPKLAAIKAYVEKGTIIHDLISAQIFVADEQGRLVEKWDKKADGDPPEILKLITSQAEAFVRWVVETPGDLEPRVWKDQHLWQSWIGYYTTTKEKSALCYVSGEEMLVADQHPAKITNDGDKAKLISSNDNTDFTFRGRFKTASEAAAVGFEVTQKAHSALRWLISRQGYRKETLAVVAWAISGQPIPQPTDDPLAILGLESQVDPEDTAQNIGRQVASLLAGYRQKLAPSEHVVVLAIDSATPGRSAMIYYRDLDGSDFLERLLDWQKTCAWLHRYASVEVQDPKTGKPRRKPLPFIGAPSPADIARAAYGDRVDGKLFKATVTRLLPCIIDGQPLPRDLMESTYRRACNRIAQERWEWEKTLSIACALFNKYAQKEKYRMSLDPERKTRDYLYGRLLALAESLEDWALSSANEKRESNAARLMQRFSEHPYSTWRTIELALAPYKARLGEKSRKRQRMIDEVVAMFDANDFTSDKRLSGEFLLGYHCQREALRASYDKPEATEAEQSAEIQ